MFKESMRMLSIYLKWGTAVGFNATSAIFDGGVINAAAHYGILEKLNETK
jgi:hypothetical protein